MPIIRGSSLVLRIGLNHALPRTWPPAALCALGHFTCIICTFWPLPGGKSRVAAHLPLKVRDAVFMRAGASALQKPLVKVTN